MDRIDNTDLNSNQGLGLKELLRKRDCLVCLIELRYDLHKELKTVNEVLEVMGNAIAKGA